MKIKKLVTFCPCQSRNSLKSDHIIIDRDESFALKLALHLKAISFSQNLSPFVDSKSFPHSFSLNAFSIIVFHSLLEIRDKFSSKRGFVTFSLPFSRSRELLLDPPSLPRATIDRIVSFPEIAIPGFFPHRFSFYFRDFPRTGGRFGRWRGFGGGGVVVPSGLSGDVDRCREQKTAILKSEGGERGELFARLFVDTFALPNPSSSSLTFLLLFAPLPLSRLSRLSRLTRLRESHS